MYNTIRHKYATVNSIIYKTWDVAQWCKSALCERSRVHAKQKVESSNLSEGIFLLNFVIIYILLDKL